MSQAARELALEYARQQGNLQAAVLRLTGLSRAAIADILEVDPKVFGRCMHGDAAALHVRRGVEQLLGLPPYELDQYLDQRAEAK